MGVIDTSKWISSGAGANSSATNSSASSNANAMNSNTNNTNTTTTTTSTTSTPLNTIASSGFVTNQNGKNLKILKLENYLSKTSIINTASVSNASTPSILPNTEWPINSNNIFSNNRVFILYLLF